ncbi:hypothetical protein MYRNA_23 [Mycobacterium phage Myrna]|uniref:Uncharacterized protein n=1 Tax=Mycobacterium phage Myrna TaxID=546805 RepID=B5LJ34_9CAUD|nr:gp23 [Mycobacterium phage Myrna]ACH62031.1 hypothetical protein MYRNA_23 [Mycobacterium phage Myrna]
MPAPRGAARLWTGKVLPSTALGEYVPVRPKEQPWKTGDEKTDTRRAMARLHPHRFTVPVLQRGVPCLLCGCRPGDKQGGRLIHTQEPPYVINPLEIVRQNEKRQRMEKRRAKPKRKPRKRPSPEQLAKDRAAYNKRRGTDDPPKLTYKEIRARLEATEPPKPRETPLDLIKVDGEAMYISRNDRWMVERVHVPQNKRQRKGLGMWRVTELVGPSPRRTWDVLDLETARLKIHRMADNTVHTRRAMMDKNYVPD